jgi:hypothetical protein
VRSDAILARLSSANPVPEREVRRLVPQEWSEEVLSSIVSDVVAPGRTRPRRARRARLLVVAALALALLAVPTYAIGRAVADGWLSGEPAPKSVVENFDSYAPQLGSRPDSRRAVLVASDGGVNLYATPNDRGSYCVATHTPDGGICIAPRVAAAPLIAGLMSSWPEQKTVIAGRVDHPAAVAVAFTDPDGTTVTREIGSSGFFVATLPAGQAASGSRPYGCRNGDWTTTFRALSASGDELVTAQITLAHARGGVCQWVNGPHR